MLSRSLPRYAIAYSAISTPFPYPCQPGAGLYPTNHHGTAWHGVDSGLGRIKATRTDCYDPIWVKHFVY